jgi:putative thioredoxin
MIDTTLSSFERDVIEASMEVPVLLDFWAPWCAPSKTLGPMLERLEREYGGRFRLVNANSDANPELVDSFSLKSIPFAVAFVDGNAVAQFVGAQPENFVRAFLDRLIPNPAEIEHRAAREAMARSDWAKAEAGLRSAIALDPSCDAARLDMAALLLERGDAAAARSHFSLLTARGDQHMAHDAVKARLESLEAALMLPPSEVLERRIRHDGGDLQARLDLAEIRIAEKRWANALEQLLEIVRRDRTFRDDIGRCKMLEVFTMAADEAELVSEYRGLLSAVVF